MRLLLAICATWWLLACSPAPQAPQSTCLPYGPRTVTLSGKAVTKMLPVAGGAAQNLLLLQLDTPICAGAGEPVAEQRHSSEIQLVPQSSFKAAYSLAGLRVTATGPLSPAKTGQHHGSVVMTLQAIGPSRAGSD